MIQKTLIPFRFQIHKSKMWSIWVCYLYIYNAQLFIVHLHTLSPGPRKKSTAVLDTADWAPHYNMNTQRKSWPRDEVNLCVRYSGPSTFTITWLPSHALVWESIKVQLVILRQIKWIIKSKMWSIWVCYLYIYNAQLFIVHLHTLSPGPRKKSTAVLDTADWAPHYNMNTQRKSWPRDEVNLCVRYSGPSTFTITWLPSHALVWESIKVQLVILRQIKWIKCHTKIKGTSIF